MRALFWLLMLGCLIPGPLWAHETKTAGQFSVLLHMEPQDSPVIGEPAQLFFAVSKAAGELYVDECGCSVTIKRAGKIISTPMLNHADVLYGSNVGVAETIFSTAGLYQVTFVAKPVKTNPFEPFELTFNVRIERQSLTEAPINPPADNSLDPSYYIYAGGIAAAGIIVIVGFKKTKSRL